MTERYVRPTIGGWLTPTLVAPWISVYTSVTALAVLGVDWGIFRKVAGWAVGMLVGSVWAFAFCLVLVLVDVALLAARARTLPVGRVGWSGSLFAPLFVFGAYAVVPPHSFWRHGVAGIAAALVIPMVVVALAVRLFAGQRPPR